MDVTIYGGIDIVSVNCGGLIVVVCWNDRAELPLWTIANF